MLGVTYAAQPLYRECDSALSVSCGDMSSRLCFDPLYPDNPRTVACLQPRSPLWIWPCLRCTYAHRPSMLGYVLLVLFCDWVTALISCSVIRSVLKTALSKPSFCVKLWSVTAVGFFFPLLGTLGPFDMMRLHNGCHGVLVGPGLLKGGGLHGENIMFLSFVTQLIKALRVIR